MIENASFQAETSGVRLDAALLSRFPSSTRAFCREACAAGEVLVDGRPALKGMKLPRGAQVLVRRLAEASDNRVAPDRSIRVHCLFEDDALLAFDKPPAQPVQPLTCHETGTLMNGVVARWPDVREIGDQPLMAGALHRIDADTSGLVLVARTPVAFDALRAQFAKRCSSTVTAGPPSASAALFEHGAFLRPQKVWLSLRARPRPGRGRVRSTRSAPE